MKLRSIVALLLAAMLLIGCTAAVAEDKVKVSIWHTFTNDQDAYLKKTAEEFNASQDKYEVVVQQQPSSGFTNSVYNAVLNGEGPDLIFNYATEAAKYVGETTYVANLDEYIYDDEIGIPDFDDLLPEYLQAEINGFEDGHIHYLPGITTGPILYYNKTLFEELNLEVPTTWQELADVCQKIKDAKGDEVLPFGVDGSPIDIMQAMMLSTGVEYVDLETRTAGFGSAVDVLAWFGEQVQKGLFSLTAPSGGYWSNDFNTGKVAMYHGSCAGIPYITPDGFEFGVAPTPTTGDDKAVYTIWNRGPIIFSANGDDAAEGAYLFAKYMYANPEVNVGWCKAMNAMTPWANAAALDEYQEFVADNASLAAVAAHNDIAISFPAITGASQMRDAISEMATKVAAGTSAEEAMAACIEVCNNALQGK